MGIKPDQNWINEDDDDLARKRISDFSMHAIRAVAIYHYQSIINRSIFTVFAPFNLLDHPSGTLYQPACPSVATFRRKLKHYYIDPYCYSC